MNNVTSMNCLDIVLKREEKQAKKKTVMSKAVLVKHKSLGEEKTSTNWKDPKKVNSYQTVKSFFFFFFLEKRTADRYAACQPTCNTNDQISNSR